MFPLIDAVGVCFDFGKPAKCLSKKPYHHLDISKIHTGISNPKVFIIQISNL